MAKSVFLSEKSKEDEKRKKAIPSQVFFNHFFAIRYHILSDLEKYDLKNINYYNNLKIRNENFSLENCKKLLCNAWSTEYAHSLASEVDNTDYYKFALHWSFPQAYYSIYLAMSAFHETQGIANEQHEKSIKLFGNSLKDNHYPKTISFFSKGLYKSFEYVGLDKFTVFPKDFSVLSKIECLEDAHLQIASFLKSTRMENAKNKRKRAENSNDKRFFTSKNEFRKNFRNEDWNLIYNSIPETSILNIMYRLRIKANYHDINTFINADINFSEFHKCISEIINYLNFVHEAYICKAIGKIEYEKLLIEFTGHLNDKKAVKRYNEYIKIL